MMGCRDCNNYRRVSSCPRMSAYPPGDPRARGEEPCSCCADKIESVGETITTLTAERDALKTRVEELEKFLRDLSCDGCAYGDDCPTHGSRHYTCIPCKCRAELEGR